MTEHMDRFARDTADKLGKGLHRQTMARAALLEQWEGDLNEMEARAEEAEAALDRLRAEHAEMAAVVEAARQVVNIAEGRDKWPIADLADALESLARSQGEAAKRDMERAMDRVNEIMAITPEEVEDLAARIQGEAPHG